MVVLFSIASSTCSPTAAEDSICVAPLRSTMNLLKSGLNHIEKTLLFCLKEPEAGGTLSTIGYTNPAAPLVTRGDLPWRDRPPNHISRALSFNAFGFAYVPMPGFAWGGLYPFPQPNPLSLSSSSHYGGLLHAACRCQ